MNKKEAIRKDIEDKAEQACPGVYIYRGRSVSFSDGGCSHSTFSNSLVLGTPLLFPSSDIKGGIARAREIALENLRLIGAEVLLVDKDWRKEHWREFKEACAGDGRFFGMHVREVSPGSLPLGAVFMILDYPEGDKEEEKTGIEREGDGKKEISLEMKQEIRRGLLGALKKNMEG